MPPQQQHNMMPHSSTAQALTSRTCSRQQPKVALVHQLVHMQGSRLHRLTRQGARIVEVVAVVVAAAVAAVVAAVVTLMMRMTTCPKRSSHFSRLERAHV